MSKINIDMDKTIKDLLKTYGDYVIKVLDFDGVRIAGVKFNTQAEKDQVVDGYYRARQSYEFLRMVANNPTKYLYYPYDIAYNGFDDDGNPGVHYGKPSVSDKLQDVENLVCARTGVSVLVPLSEGISYHVLTTMYKPGESWIYYGDGHDCAAENILKLNKRVHLIDKSGLARLFLSIVPAHRFAVSQKVRGGK